MYFTTNKPNRKKAFSLKWLVFGMLFIAIIFLFIPGYLYNRAEKIVNTAIPDTSAVCDSCPDTKIFMAYNYLQTSLLFPGHYEKSRRMQSLIFRWYYPLYVKDYNSLKYSCVDFALNATKDTSSLPVDSLRMKILSRDWTLYSDSASLNTFLLRWGAYQKYFKCNLKDFYYIVDRKNPKL